VKQRLRPSNRRFRVLLRLPNGDTKLIELLARAPNEVRKRVSRRQGGGEVMRIWEA